MPTLSSRRQFALGLASAPFLTSTVALAADDTASGAVKAIAALESAVGARLGVTLIDATAMVRLAYRADERFPMCSTFKLLASAAVLARVDAGTDRPDRVVPYKAGDLLSYAPVAKAHVADGGMRLGDLCAAAIQWSDNTAANLILDAIGGPPGFTQFCRSLGDTVTRLDRNEPTLNTAFKGDDRDTTAPKAMAMNLRAVFTGDRLTAQSRRQLAEWAIGDKVADKRVRAGLPKDWVIGDKTGTGDFGTTNTIGFIKPATSDTQFFFSVYLTQSTAPADRLGDIHREIGRIFTTLV
jgi:beta-lactamase class A